MMVRDVKKQHAAGRQTAQVHGDRLAGDQMHWNRVRAECIQHDEIERARLFPHREARIAEDDRHRRQTIADEREEGSIARHRHSRRIDFVERPVLTARAVTGH